MTGLCGDQCTHCPRYIATQTGCPAGLEKVHELWVRLGLLDDEAPVMQIKCRGCNHESGCVYPELCDCVREKEVRNCGFCASYPCALIENVFEKTSVFRIHASDRCTPEEMEVLEKAFFSKQKYFEHIRRNAG
ncbi:DUF3795 domain-containing protein [bacterium]|nr:DUF3795 domain-containing protein [bacterium]